MVDIVFRLCYTDHMLMMREPASWQKFMNDREREELELAERVQDAAADQLRLLKRRIKDRCLKRRMRANSDK